MNTRILETHAKKNLCDLSVLCREKKIIQKIVKLLFGKHLFAHAFRTSFTHTHTHTHRERERERERIYIYISATSFCVFVYLYEIRRRI